VEWSYDGKRKRHCSNKACLQRELNYRNLSVEPMLFDEVSRVLRNTPRQFSCGTPKRNQTYGDSFYSVARRYRLLPRRFWLAQPVRGAAGRYFKSEDVQLCWRWSMPWFRRPLLAESAKTGDARIRRTARRKRSSLNVRPASTIPSPDQLGQGCRYTQIHELAGLRRPLASWRGLNLRRTRLLVF
jgi:hypothetical protein